MPTTQRTYSPVQPLRGIPHQIQTSEFVHFHSQQRQAFYDCHWQQYQAFHAFSHLIQTQIDTDASGSPSIWISSLFCPARCSVYVTVYLPSLCLLPLFPVDHDHLLELKCWFWFDHLHNNTLSHLNLWLQWWNLLLFFLIPLCDFPIQLRKAKCLCC